MKINRCSCSVDHRELCPLHKKRNVRRDFYKYEDEYLTQQQDDEDDDRI